MKQNINDNIILQAKKLKSYSNIYDETIDFIVILVCTFVPFTLLLCIFIKESKTNIIALIPLLFILLGSSSISLFKIMKSYNHYIKKLKQEQNAYTLYLAYKNFM